MNENKILPTILAGGKSSRFGSDKSMAILGDKKLGIIDEVKDRRHHTKPSVKKRLAKKKAIARHKKKLRNKN